MYIRNTNLAKKTFYYQFYLNLNTRSVTMKRHISTESSIMVLERFIHGSYGVKYKVTTDCKLPWAQMQVIFIRVFCCIVKDHQNNVYLRQYRNYFSS